MNTNLLVDVKQEWFFLGLNLHEFPSVHDKKGKKKCTLRPSLVKVFEILKAPYKSI